MNSRLTFFTLNILLRSCHLSVKKVIFNVYFIILFFCIYDLHRYIIYIPIGYTRRKNGRPP